MAIILVTYEGITGQTQLLADHLTQVLQSQAVEVDRREVLEVISVEPYETVIIGSDLDGYCVPEEVAELLESLETSLNQRPLWLFFYSSREHVDYQSLQDGRNQTSLQPLLERLNPESIAVFSHRQESYVQVWLEQLIQHQLQLASTRSFKRSKGVAKA